MLGIAALGVACAGSSAQKKEPMVADSTSSDSEVDVWKGYGEEGGAAAAEGADAGEPSAAGAASAGAGSNEDGAQRLLKQFVAPDADHAALTRSLRPTAGDYRAMFDAASAPKIEAAQAKDWDSKKAIIKPKANQTEVKIWSATGADLAAWKGNAKEFPDGYKRVAKHLVPTVVFFRFKFVEAGKDQGTGYDGLAFVNGRWVIAPKPWKALEGGKDDDDAAEAAPAKKPKPKKKKKK
jgi:hypothetical protein